MRRPIPNHRHHSNQIQRPSQGKDRRVYHWTPKYPRFHELILEACKDSVKSTGRECLDSVNTLAPPDTVCPRRSRFPVARSRQCQGSLALRLGSVGLHHEPAALTEPARTALVSQRGSPPGDQAGDDDDARSTAVLTAAGSAITVTPAAGCARSQPAVAARSPSPRSAGRARPGRSPPAGRRPPPVDPQP
jgi:hypothetical protein